MDEKKPFDLLVPDARVRTIFAQSIYASYRPHPLTLTLRRLASLSFTRVTTNDNRSTF